MSKIFGCIVAFFCTVSLAHAYGVSFAVDSLEKARSIQSRDTSKHILVFYTVPTN